MAEEDEEKTAFITSQRIFCYTKMPFGLRNAGATYQCLVNKAFHKQIGRNLKVYVDDLVIKSRTEDEIVRNIKETFKTLREINMKLNPKKYTFGIEEGMFLGYKVSTRGLKVCPDKVDAVLSHPSPNRAFKKMKRFIAELPMLVALMEKEELIVYLAAAKETVLSRPEVAGRLQKWSIELGEYAIHYRPRVSVKGHILADCIVERPEEDYPNTLMAEKEELPEPWILFTDGSSCTDGSGAGLILTNPEGMEFTYALRFRFDATNNEAEYEALIARLKIAEQIGVKNLQANVDLRSFKAFSIKQVPRSENKKADTLSKIASTSFAHLSKQVLVEELKEKSISATEVLEVVEEEGDTWMTPIFKYLTEETLPADVKKARAVRRKSQCMHAGTRSVMAKALRIGYYWPTMHEDARTLIRACQDCQVHKPILRNPQQKLTPITSPWPFYKWGIDIAGPFPEGPGKVKFWIVAIDYFTKWIEAKPVATITGNQIKKFVWDNIVLERANRSLEEGIKAKLDERSKNWMEELPHVLWAHRTMIKSSNGDTPFSLTYGTEAVIPTEIGMPTLRTAELDQVQNNEALEINLDYWKNGENKQQYVKQRAKQKWNGIITPKFKVQVFKPGDRNNEASRAKDTGKLGPKWEGPYEVTKALGKKRI
ncbi:reverse transcriptase domain-containing protein [Tanacetum coccineum]